MKRFCFSLLFSVFLVSSLFSTTSPEEKIRVGICFTPPFVIVDSVSMTGVCVDLWHQISDSLNVTYRYIEFTDYPSMLEGLADGKIDLVINPLSMTDKRLMHYRLSIPFYTSNMGVVTNPSSRIPIFAAIRHLMNWQTIKMTLLLLSFVFIFAVLIWLFEYRVNPTEFRKGHKGISDGIWWAFVTMSTVGYGDKVPKSKMGRMLTIFWMLYAIALFFVFIAEISSELTITKMQSDITSLEDLRKIKVGTIGETGYAYMLQVNHMKYTPFNSLADGFNALKKNRIDAFIEDAGTMEYIIATYGLGKNLVLNRTQIRNQYFCLAASKENIELIDRINPELLDITESVKWEKILEHYNMKE